MKVSDCVSTLGSKISTHNLMSVEFVDFSDDEKGEVWYEKKGRSRAYIYVNQAYVQRIDLCVDTYFHMIHSVS